MKLTGKVVFASGRACDFDIWKLDIESGALAQLTEGEGLNDYPKWSPDGRRIAYVATGADAIPSVCIMAADGSGQQRLTEKVYCRYLAWSPDGKRLLFSGNADNPDEIDLYTIAPEPNAEPERVFSREGVESEPSWSPDGEKILFASSPLEDGVIGFNTEIYEYTFKTKELKRLTDHPSRDYCPTYSPDGSSIAFVSHRNRTSHDTYQTKLAEVKALAQGEDMRALTEAIGELKGLEQDSDIWLMDSDGTNEQPLTDNSGIEVGLTWSPCGQYIMYSAAPAGDHEAERLRVIEIASGSSVALSYNRTALEREIGAEPERYLNRNPLLYLLPDAIERRFVDASFWGEERHPDWCRVQ